ncbi:acyclic terpene utilization AtuA family protein [Oceanomicrobium pacificus]|uniref:Acyclic terpene utilization AtuA family protein n=1 Tax=Oceanomicrobium pacificus TaxID=2692916 RepID=A0A6B0TRP1_9RHOB|nr:acyclic terpene utilization AtuA family protein [Oceanomicrobium pacificus]MXU66636.1 acyclic terpene utilization AtuA family protein [Oceanomicrobium pacificus]
MAETRILVPSGVLGLGFSAEALAAGVARAPHAICIDGGSTDSGPFYLGSGTSKYSRAACKAEWRQIMAARAELGVPLIIGSSGTCGVDAMVDWMVAITEELAAERGETLRIARLYCEQPPARVAAAFGDGRVHDLTPAPSLDPDRIASLDHVVALAGVEQIGAALDSGADIIIAGRTTDTATIAAMPMRRGTAPGIAWHGAKIAECGALCSTHPTSGVILVTFEADRFTVEAMEEGASCTPRSVSAHMLYENADPVRLTEPGGHLDVSAATYVDAGDGRVRVSGAVWHPDPIYKVKLEGARRVGHQISLLALLRDPHYVANAAAWVDGLERFLHGKITAQMDLTRDAYHLEFRLIGRNAVLGALEAQTGTAPELGVLCLVTAPDAATADEMAKLVNPFLLHHPLTPDEELPTFAFPYSPAQSDRGPVYEFALNHVMTLDDPMEAFRLEVDP